MVTLITQIIFGNVLVGTLFVGLFTLRHMVKLKRSIDNTCATVPTEQATEKKSVFTWEYQPHYNAGGGAGGGGGHGGAGGYVEYVLGDWKTPPKGE